MSVVKSQTPVPVTHPKITSATLLSISDAEKGSLRDVLALLNSLFVRNRNQHRRNHWFKSLQQFRKQLGLLLDEMDGKSVKVKEDKLTRRLQFWDEGCIHSWYL
jgi:ribonuclease MRP protein subunit RMP1